MKRGKAITERLELVRLLRWLGCLGHPARPPPAPPPPLQPEGHGAQRGPWDDPSQELPLPSPEELPQEFWEETGPEEPAWTETE